MRLNKYNAFEKIDKTIHILFVDDGSTTLSVTKRLFERLGYRVSYANSSIETIELMVEYHDVFDDIFDVIITDYYLPDMNGIELAIEAKKTLVNIPIILYTGKLDILNEIQFAETVLAGIITKPCSINEFDSLIKTVLMEKKWTYQRKEKFQNMPLFH